MNPLICLYKDNQPGIIALGCAPWWQVLGLLVLIGVVSFILAFKLEQRQ